MKIKLFLLVALFGLIALEVSGAAEESKEREKKVVRFEAPLETMQLLEEKEEAEKIRKRVKRLRKAASEVVEERTEKAQQEQESRALEREESALDERLEKRTEKALSDALRTAESYYHLPQRVKDSKELEEKKTTIWEYRLSLLVDEKIKKVVEEIERRLNVVEKELKTVEQSESIDEEINDSKQIKITKLEKRLNLLEEAAERKEKLTSLCIKNIIGTLVSAIAVYGSIKFFKKNYPNNKWLRRMQPSHGAIVIAFVGLITTGVMSYNI